MVCSGFCKEQAPIVFVIAFLFPVRKLLKAVIDWLNRH